MAVVRRVPLSLYAHTLKFSTFFEKADVRADRESVAGMVAKVWRKVVVDFAEGTDIEEFGEEDSDEVKRSARGGADAHRIAACAGGDCEGVLAREFAQGEFGRRQWMHGVVEGERFIEPTARTHLVVNVGAG